MAPSLRSTSSLSLLMMVRLLAALLLLASLVLAAETDEHNDGTDVEEHDDEEAEEAVLFPFFTIAIGVFVYYILSRWVRWLPYTAVMFTIGTIISVVTFRLRDSDVLEVSVVEDWATINGELVLLIFLPGLIFKDAFCMNVHLLRAAFWQCVAFAVPMVLAGTALTALVGFYILPYGWTTWLSLTFGAILSATDPVAVAALLDSVGAPPRLKVHISGEALMNDGSAIVFFTIFYEKYLYSLGIGNHGEDIGWGEGIALFFRMSLGGVGSGIFFGLGILLIIYILKRRLSHEENVVEVSATLALAYLCYYTTDVVWGCSGVIAVFTQGLMLKAFGQGLLNDEKLLQDFWVLVEHLLNTVLFTLAGVLWGRHISNGDALDGYTFEAKDWGYLILMYVLAQIIRYFLFGLFYPITRNIGLKTNWKETFFQCYGGLRGAVGICLAIFVDQEVTAITADLPDEERIAIQRQTHDLFAIVGGVAFLTLLINATTAGPLLRKLGLTDSGVLRKKILDAIYDNMKKDVIEHLVRLLAQRRFHRVNFAIVRNHVHMLQDLTEDELMEAVMRFHEDNKMHPSYYPPVLDHVLPYVIKPDEEEPGAPSRRMSYTYSAKYLEFAKELKQSRQNKQMRRASDRTVYRTLTPKTLNARLSIFYSGESPHTLTEIRLIFLEILRSCYWHQIRFGDLRDREFIVYALLQSIDLAADDVSHEKSLDDWDFVTMFKRPMSHLSEDTSCLTRIFRKCVHVPTTDRLDMKYAVERCLAFVEGHKQARRIIKEEFFVDDIDLSQSEMQVISESKEECTKAMRSLDAFPKADVERVVSHKLCTILLSGAVKRVETLTESGLVKEIEAEEFLEEIQAQLEAIGRCKLTEHPGEMPLISIQEEEEEILEEEKKVPEQKGERRPRPHRERQMSSVRRRSIASLDHAL